MLIFWSVAIYVMFRQLKESMFFSGLFLSNDKELAN